MLGPVGEERKGKQYIAHTVLGSFTLGILNMSNDYTECPRRNGQNFGRVFLMLK